MRGWHPKSRFFEVDGLRAHAVVLDPFVTHGPVAPGAQVAFPDHPDNPPTLVLLHGIAVSSWAWRHNLEALSRHCRVIALCHKGHGWSGRPGVNKATDPGQDIPALSRFVLGAMDHLGVEKATLVGNSLGGGVSLWTALTAPERVDKLILVNPASHVAQLPWPLLRTQVQALAPVYRAIVGPTLLRIPLTAIAYRNLPIDRDYMAGFWAPFEAKGAMRALVATARALPEGISALDARLAEISHETLIIWGERDGLLSASTAHRLRRKLPHARLVLIPEAGHCPHEETPARFNELVLDFVGRSTASTASTERD
jgi:pimeloyl-ACP methyl ester carboxylesterase